MADVKEDIKAPVKFSIPPVKPDAKGAVAPSSAEVPIGFGVITPEMERYRGILAKDPTSRVFAALSELYRKAGMLDEAIKLCLGGTKSHPNYMSGLVALSRAYFDKGMVKESKDELLKVVAVTPDNIVARKILGDINVIEGDIPSAKENYTKILNLSPDDTEIKQKLAGLSKAAATTSPKATASDSPAAKTQPSKAPITKSYPFEDVLDGESLELVEDEKEDEIIEDIDLFEAGGKDVSGEDLLGGEEITFKDKDTDAAGDMGVFEEEVSSPKQSIESVSEDLIKFDEDINISEDSIKSGAAGIDEFAEGTDEIWEIDETASDDRSVGDSDATDSDLEFAEGGGDEFSVEAGEDQELTDEFGILQEGDEEITINNLDETIEPPTKKVPKRMETIESVDRGDDLVHELRKEQSESEVTSDDKGVTITTETIADIYVKQGYFDKALTVYQELMEANPSRESLKRKIAFVNNKMNALSGEGSIPLSPKEEEPVETVTVPSSKPVRPVESHIASSAKDDRERMERNIQALNGWLSSIKKNRLN